MPSFLTSRAVQSIETTSFSGPDQIGDDILGPSCQTAQNIEFDDRSPCTRRGFAEAFDPNQIVRTLYNWIQTQSNRLLRFTSTGSVVSRDLHGVLPEFNILTSISARGMTCAQAGFRIFMAFFSPRSGQPGMIQAATTCRVWDGTFTLAVPNIDTIFPSALTSATVTVSSAEPGAGSITAGDHQVMFLITGYNGATPPPSPSDAPYTFTASGSMSGQITLTPTSTWPTWVSTVQLIMTTATNPNRWYLVPSAQGGVQALARGTSFAVNFTIDFDDVTLQLFEEILPGTSNDFFSVVPTGGTITPHHICAYGTRMAYLFESLGPDGLTTATYIAFSEPGRFQFVTFSRHVISLPEFRIATTSFVLGDVFYVCGPTHTYALSDNGLLPVQWAQPRLVSGSIGTPFPRGVLANPTRGYAWVADRAGLFWFGGTTFPDLPASHRQSLDWQKINWNAQPDALEINDDPTQRLVIVKVPLDDATDASHLMVWDYTFGYAPDMSGQGRGIRYCGLWPIDSFTPGGSAMVLNPSTGELEFWCGRSGTAGNVLRQRLPGESAEEADQYDDDGAGIDSFYSHGPYPGIPTAVMKHIGVDLRVKGAGDLALSAQSLDEVRTLPLAPIALSSAPGRRYPRLFSLESEGGILLLSNGAVAGAYFNLSGLRWFYIPFAVRS